MKGIKTNSTLSYFPSPKFKAGLDISESVATVKAIITTENGKVKEVVIIEVTPKTLPIEPIESALKKATFTSVMGSSLYKEEVEFSFDIVVPEKIKPVISIENITRK